MLQWIIFFFLDSYSGVQPSPLSSQYLSDGSSQNVHFGLKYKELN